MALSFADAAPLSLGPSAGAGSLREVDELVRDGEAKGLVFVQGAAAVLDALGRHVERRARALGRTLVKIDGPTDDAWRELVSRLLPAQPLDVLAAAQGIVDRAGPAMVVVREDVVTCFGRALAGEVVRGAAEGRALFLVLTESAPASTPARLVEVTGEVSADDLHLFWDAVARDPDRGAGTGAPRLDVLESWWGAARATPISYRAAPPSLGPAAERLFARFSLSQRSWPAAQIHRLGPAVAAQELVRVGVLTLGSDGRISAGSAPAPAVEVDDADRMVVASALEALSEPWATARAHEVYAAAGAFDQAEAAAVRALSASVDPAARADFWERWERTLACLPEEEALPRLLRSVDLALRAGDVDRALGLGSAALARKPDAFATWLALGRANVARGDLSTANYWLGKALARALKNPGARAMVDVELAEVRHMEGDIEGARRHAAAALDDAQADAATRLHARNVVGKVLLAQSAWTEAEAHFAADACEAALLGDPTAELRARLNRAIALLSGGRLDDARAMLAGVLGEGEARGELRAVAYALSNLATIALLKREYVEALRLHERAFEARRRLGDKVTLALLITNLAELKLQLGMVAEAEQALAFGRQACGPGMPGSRVSHFAITAALIHLERGRTALASAELKTALGAARGSPHGARLGECWRLAARIALEDGDLSAAAIAIGHASEAAESPRERAWVSVLEAARARAAGEPFADDAAEALDRARTADDPELCREALVLLHQAAVLDGDRRAARAHLDAAAALRDQIADSLPEDMRGRFLARRDLAELAKLCAGYEPSLPRGEVTLPVPKPQLDLALSEGARSVPSQSVSRPAAPIPALRRMVGRTPSMLALGTAILKVGQSDATVLVHGESGTGKELVAEAIHEASARRAGPIVKVNCAALVETLLLSELFGHEKGSFTGAAARRRGRFELAEGGTLFLDEIGDISPRTQVALLRVLQDKTFERVGGVTPLRANVRIVCATHRDLSLMVSRGEFREDLYYRLRGVVLEVPALRQRLADLPLLAAAVLDRIAAERGISPKRLSPSAAEALGRHGWPGNVRELENALRAAALFAETEVIEPDDLTLNVASLKGLRGAEPPVSELAVPEPPPATLTSSALVPADQSDGTDGAFDDAAMSQPSKIAHSGSREAPGTATEVAYAAIRAGISLSDLKRDIERDCIARALAETGGNITRAAGLLGMKRPRLSQLVKQYGFGGPAGAGYDVPGGGDPEGDAEDGE